ncbi:MAG TPA: low temperature requirement protein A [Stenotrophomonas sp.]|nr:low temperature requirement protein A [Stenotrophomonas sp.]
MPVSLHADALLRRRDGHHARVTFVELFFDLVYVFAVTQVSHLLLHHLDPLGALQTLIVWFAVWLGWQYTCWASNWFDPDKPAIRGLMFTLMLLAMLLSAAIPQAFGERAWLFAGSYVAIQLGRTVYIRWLLRGDHALAPNYSRMCGWLSISALLWIGGAMAPSLPWRMALWAIAVACEYLSPMFGFALPVLGRSRTSEWTIEGGHLAERCQLFVIVALGETLLASGASLADTEQWTGSLISALLATFFGTLGMWWLYFATSCEDATRRITHSPDPGRIGAAYHYVHAILVAGIIVTAVGNDLVLAHPHAHPLPAQTAVLLAGPAIYLVGSAIYKRVVYGRAPRSHVGGVLALALLAALASHLDLLMLGWATTAVVVATGLAEMRGLRRDGPLAA